MTANRAGFSGNSFVLGTVSLLELDTLPARSTPCEEQRLLPRTNDAVETAWFGAEALMHVGG